MALQQYSRQENSRQENSRQYSSEDVQQIVAIATRGQEHFSPAYLQEMAQELAIDSEVMDRAIETWESQKAQQLKKQQKRQRFYRFELLPYLAVNTFLLMLNFAIAGTITWAIYPLVGWGLGLLLMGPLHGGSKPKSARAALPCGES